MLDEKQPIKRSVELAPLSREHHDGLLFSWKLKQGLKKNISPERLKKFTIWFWKSHIKPHFYQEEKIIAPYLSPGHSLFARMHSEHEYIREYILKLDKEAEVQTFLQLADLVNEHIQFEERDLFTYLEKALSPEQLSAIHQQLEQHPVCAGDWEDEFWKN